MNDLKPPIIPQGDIQTLLDLCENTRFSALSLDDETQEPVLYTLMLSSEIEDLTAVKTYSPKAGIQAFVASYPCLVLTAEARLHDFQWVIPLWHSLARQWLQAVQSQGQFQVLLQASDQPELLSLMRMRVPDRDVKLPLGLDTADQDSDCQNSTDAMLVSGFRALVEQHADPDKANRLRLAVACDPARADALYETYQLGSALVNQLFEDMATQTKH